MSDIAKFYTLKSSVDINEQKLKETKKQLETDYAALVHLCPHSEAVDRPASRLSGVTRCCVICGVTDYASEGGDPGDEYNYGHHGHPHREFWKNTKTRVVSDKEFGNYERHHNYVVTNGQVRDRFS